MSSKEFSNRERKLASALAHTLTDLQIIQYGGYDYKGSEDVADTMQSLVGRNKKTKELMRNTLRDLYREDLPNAMKGGWPEQIAKVMRTIDEETGIRMERRTEYHMMVPVVLREAPEERIEHIRRWILGVVREGLLSADEAEERIVWYTERLQDVPQSKSSK